MPFPSSSLLVVASAAFSLTNALPWPGPQKTAVYTADQWTPRPTSLPTDPKRLFKKQATGVNICGWVNGDAAAPVGCASGSSCVHDTIHGYIGCCATTGPCTQGVYTSCVDYKSAGWSQRAGPQENGVYTCQAAALCYRNTYPGGYYQYGCGPSSAPVSVATTYIGQPSAALLQLVYTGVSHFYDENQRPVSTGSGGSMAKSPLASPSKTDASMTASFASDPSSRTSAVNPNAPLGISVSPASSRIFSALPSTSSSQDSSSNPSSTSGLSSSTNIASSTPSTTNPAAITSSAASPAATKSKSATIAGGILGGVAAIILLIALVLYLRRRQQKKLAAAEQGPSLKSILKNPNPPFNSTFQPLSPYDPADGFAPSQPTRLRGGGGWATDDTAVSLLSESSRGANTCDQTYVPSMETPSRTYIPSMAHSHSRSLSGEHTPLMTEIDDFSRSFSAAIREVSAASSLASDSSAHGNGLYTPPYMLTNSAYGVSVPPPARNSRSRASSGSISERSPSPSPEIPLKSPRRLTANPRRLEEAIAALQAGSVPDVAPREDGLQRYELIDPGPRSANVPILRGPGQLKAEKLERARAVSGDMK